MTQKEFAGGIFNRVAMSRKMTISQTKLTVIHCDWFGELICENHGQSRAPVFISRKFLFIVVLLSAVPGGNECGDKEKVAVVEDGDAPAFPVAVVGKSDQAAGGPCRTVVVQLTWIKAVTVSAAVVVICQLEPHNLVHIADRPALTITIAVAP